MKEIGKLNDVLFLRTVYNGSQIKGVDMVVLEKLFSIRILTYLTPEEELNRIENSILPKYLEQFKDKDEQHKLYQKFADEFADIINDGKGLAGLNEDQKQYIIEYFKAMMVHVMSTFEITPKRHFEWKRSKKVSMTLDQAMNKIEEHFG